MPRLTASSLSLLVDAAEASIRWPGAERQTGGAGTK